MTKLNALGRHDLEALDAKLKPTCPPQFSGRAKFHEAALYWIDFGLQVIPIVPGSKRTAVKWDGWLANLSTHSITQFWREHQDHEVGFIVGDNYIVLDADSLAAVDALTAAEGRHRTTPLMIVQTKRGEHHYFKNDPSILTKSASFIDGQATDRIDIKTGRTMVVLPPSAGKIILQFGGANA